MEKSNDPPFAYSRLVCPLRASRCSRIDMLGAVSCSTKEEFHEFYKIPDDSDIEVVHNGCDARVFRPPNKDHEGEQLAHERIRKEYGCGRRSTQLRSENQDADDSRSWSSCCTKRIRLTLRALPLILKEHENATIIVGRGHMKKKLLKIAEELGVSESLFIKSAMSFEDLANTIGQQIWLCSILLRRSRAHPTRSTRFRTPVVTVDQASLTEMIDDTVGGLFIEEISLTC